MKTLGLLGGLSWYSSLEYYRRINEGINFALENQSSPKLILNSLDFQFVTELFKTQEKARVFISNESKRLEDIGCDGILLASNTVHFCYEAVCEKVNVPVLHIADAVGQALERQGVSCTALLGTRFTMNLNFYKVWLKKKYNIETKTPKGQHRIDVNRIIYDELVLGDIRASSRERYVDIINTMASEGSEAVILGCTEIPLLIKAQDVDIPVIDSTKEHCNMAINWLLK